MMNWKHAIGAGIGLLAAVATILGVGYSLGKDHNEALVAFLREKNQALENAEKTLRAQVEALKLEFKPARDAQPTSVGALAGRAAAEGNASGTLTVDPKVPSTAKTQTVSISRGNTARLFDGEILISLQGLNYEGNPLRHRVYATVGKVGKPNKDLQAVDTGYALIYEGFEVRVTESSTFSATFVVTHLDGGKH